MSYHMFGGPNSPVRVLSTFTYCYLACQMMGISLILGYFGIKRLTRGKGDIATFAKNERWMCEKASSHSISTKMSGKRSGR
jgi:hypothetical protein